MLVTLEVWGKALMDETGIVRSQHARIIGYDATDYYYLIMATPENPRRSLQKHDFARFLVGSQSDYHQPRIV